MARLLGEDQQLEIIERVHDRARNITALLCSPSEACHYFKLATYTNAARFSAFRFYV